MFCCSDFTLYLHCTRHWIMCFVPMRGFVMKVYILLITSWEKEMIQRPWCNTLFSLYVGVTLDELCSPELSGIPLLHRLPYSAALNKTGNTMLRMCRRWGGNQTCSFYNTHWMTLMNVLQIFKNIIPLELGTERRYVVWVWVCFYISRYMIYLYLRLCTTRWYSNSADCNPWYRCIRFTDGCTCEKIIVIIKL